MGEEGKRTMAKPTLQLQYTHPIHLRIEARKEVPSYMVFSLGTPLSAESNNAQLLAQEKKLAQATSFLARGSSGECQLGINLEGNPGKDGIQVTVLVLGKE